jgi:DNA polymerase I-like protein with 3'-5' exonuclease and polymerase domains
MVAPGEAVRKLIQLREELFFPVGNKEKEPVSKKIKSYLYAKEKR